MARSLGRDPSIKQKNDASSIGNNRGMARRAKRHSNKVDRQRLKRQLEGVVELTKEERKIAENTPMSKEMIRDILRDMDRS